MAGFFPPPPVFVGGAQPYAPKVRVTPSYVSDNPPLRGPIDTEVLFVIRQAWELAYVPQQRQRFLAPATPDNPPRFGPIDRASLYAIRGAWELPYVPRQRTPTVTASYVSDNPPIRGPIEPRLWRALVQQWDIPYIPPTRYARAAFGTAQAPSNPPIRGPLDAELLYVIRQAWELPYVPPHPRAKFTPSGGDTILFTKNRDTGIVVSIWPVPPLYPLPQVASKLVQGLIAPDYPPPPSTQWFQIQGWWQQLPPPLPQVAPKLVQTGPVPDNPPIRGPLAAMALANILEAWIPPPWDTRYVVMQPQSGPDEPPKPPDEAKGGATILPNKPWRWWGLGLYELEVERRITEQARLEQIAKQRKVAPKPAQILAKAAMLSDGTQDLKAEFLRNQVQWKATYKAVLKELHKEYIAERMRQDDDETVLLLLMTLH